MLSETFVRNYLLQGRVSIQAFLSNNLSNYYLIKNLLISKLKIALIGRETPLCKIDFILSFASVSLPLFYKRS